MILWFLGALEWALSLIFKWFAPEIIGLVVKYLAQKNAEKALELARHKAFNDAKTKILQAGTNKDLTEEQRLKEQENAFKDLLATVNRIV